MIIEYQKYLANTSIVIKIEESFLMQANIVQKHKIEFTCLYSDNKRQILIGAIRGKNEVIIAADFQSLEKRKCIVIINDFNDWGKILDQRDAKQKEIEALQSQIDLGNFESYDIQQSTSSRKFAYKPYPGRVYLARGNGHYLTGVSKEEGCSIGFSGSDIFAWVDCKYARDHGYVTDLTLWDIMIFKTLIGCSIEEILSQCEKVEES